MRNSWKKAVSVAAASAITLSMAAMASAATTTPFGVSVQDGVVSFVKNGVASTSATSKDSRITLTTSTTTGSLLVSFTDSTGKVRNFSLGDQNTVQVSGSMASLTLAQNLADNIAVDLASGSSVTTMTVATPNPVAINGNVGTLNVSDSATVSIAGSAKVTRRNVTDTQAKVTTTAVGVAATAAPGAATTTVKKPSSTLKLPAASSQTTQSTTTTASGKLRLRTTPIETEDSSVNLSEIADELNDNVEAYDTATGDSVSGTCRWRSPGSTASKDGKYSFVFEPDDPDYSSVSGTIQVYLDGAYGELTLRGFDDAEDNEDEDGDGLIAHEGDSISSLNSDLDGFIWAEDEDGNEVDGKTRFTESGRFDSSGRHQYQIKFTPDDTRRYETVTDRVYVYVIPEED